MSVIYENAIVRVVDFFARVSDEFVTVHAFIAAFVRVVVETVFYGGLWRETAAVGLENRDRAGNALAI